MGTEKNSSKETRKRARNLGKGEDVVSHVPFHRLVDAAMTQNIRFNNADSTSFLSSAELLSYRSQYRHYRDSHARPFHCGDQLYATLQKPGRNRSRRP